MTGSFPDGVRPIVLIGASGWLGRAVAAEAATTALGVISVGRSAGSDVEVTSYDVADLNAVLRSLTPQVVINCAGLVRGSADDLRAANVDPVRSVVAAARDLPLRLVQIGSAAEYGDPGNHDPVDEAAPLRPTSDYGRSKALASELVLESSVDSVVARVFNVAGPQPAPGSLLAELLTKVDNASTDIFLGNADHARDWVTLDFAARAIVALATVAQVPEVVNVCSGQSTTHGQFVVAIAEASGRTIRVHSSGLPGIAAIIGSAERLAQATGLRANTTPHELAMATLGLDRDAHQAT